MRRGERISEISLTNYCKMDDIPVLRSNLIAAATSLRSHPLDDGRLTLAYADA
jgi:hypothetical protein